MKLIIKIIIVLFFIQCKNNVEQPVFVKNIMKREKRYLKKYEAFYIIPPTVCASCNSYPQRMAYMILKKTSKVKVFFECFPEDYETVVAKLKENDVWDTPNSTIDTLLLYSNFDSISNVNSPAIVYIQNGLFHSFEILSAETPNVISDLIDKKLK